MTTVYKPRPWQPQMSAHILEHARCNLFAGTGLGKTSSTLDALTTLFLFDQVRHALVVSTKRVARDTWPQAVRNFAPSFGHLTVAVAIGDDKTRRAAIAQRAHITTINFDNLEWLVDSFGTDWYWDMVVVDESTKLRGLRASIRTHKKTGKRFMSGQGASRAKALARVAHTKKINRWVNLTGTPSLAGLEALWGPTWFLDAGQRLGNSFTAFTHRWFRALPGSTKEKQLIEPMPHAEVQIRAAIADITLVVDIKDYVDVGDPIENIIHIDLPPSAKKQYDQMAKELWAEIDGVEIEAFSAATKSQKCLSAETEVLTTEGWVRIEEITKAHAIWDGVEWVMSDGAISNGVKETLDCWGVKMTPDHLVLTTHGWKTALEVLEDAIQNKRFGRAAVRLPDNNRKSRVNAIRWKVESAMARALRLRKRVVSNWLKFETTEPEQDEIVRVPPRGTIDICSKVARHGLSQSISPVERCETTSIKPNLKGLEQLWGTRNNNVRTVAGIFRGFLGRHDPHIFGQSATGSDRQQRTLRTGELQMGYSSGELKQSTSESFYRNAERSHDRRTSSASFQFEIGHADTAVAKQLALRETVFTTVFDIVNCGPRNRFTVRGRTGEIFIAHNCLQIASGAAYIDDKQNWVLAHDEKIEALKSIEEEALGTPLLVFYHFKSDLARILKAFPKAKLLDDDPKTKSDWEAGKIPMLLAHPASAGHGVDGLQHGTNTCVFFSTNWSAENDAQAIERIGPTRQMQSGYDRPVTVHRIVARGTVEEAAVARLRSRVSVDQALRDGLKQYRQNK